VPLKVRVKDRIVQIGINSLLCGSLLKLVGIIPESAVNLRKIYERIYL